MRQRPPNVQLVPEETPDLPRVQGQAQDQPQPDGGEDSRNPSHQMLLHRTRLQGTTCQSRTRTTHPTMSLQRSPVPGLELQQEAFDTEVAGTRGGPRARQGKVSGQVQVLPDPEGRGLRCQGRKGLLLEDRPHPIHER